MRFTRLNAINERLLYWDKRSEETHAAWFRAVKAGSSAEREWDEWCFCVSVLTRLRQMLGEEEAKPTPAQVVKEMIWRWLWWAKRCMTRDRPAHQ